MVLLITVGSVPEKQKQKGSVGADESVREAKVLSPDSPDSPCFLNEPVFQTVRVSPGSPASLHVTSRLLKMCVPDPSVLQDHSRPELNPSNQSFHIPYTYKCLMPSTDALSSFFIVLILTLFF